MAGRRKNNEVYVEWRKMNAIYNEDGSVYKWVTCFGHHSDEEIGRTDLAAGQLRFSDESAQPPYVP